jgi:hypothetical protein
MKEATDMSHHASSTELRTAAVRMVAATEYFKAAGRLPPWAHGEREPEHRADVVERQHRPLVLSAS